MHSPKAFHPPEVENRWLQHLLLFSICHGGQALSGKTAVECAINSPVFHDVVELLCPTVDKDVRTLST